jgi:hypothetical protein
MATLTVQPTVLDLKLYAGDGFTMRMIFVDKISGDPWPADGEWLAQVRASPPDTDILTDFTVDTTDAATGIILLSLSGVQTATLAENGQATWDVQQIETGADPRTWYRGVVRTISDVTR